VRLAFSDASSSPTSRTYSFMKSTLNKFISSFGKVIRLLVRSDESLTDKTTAERLEEIERRLSRVDFLALMRTTLANERTTLAYLRTSISLFLLAIALIHFFAGNVIYERLGAGAFFVGLLSILLGAYRYAQVQLHILAFHKDMEERDAVR